MITPNYQGVTIQKPLQLPTLNLCINKSRIKIYKNVGDLPTYYLNKGSEFQLELFNPTTSVILAKITLNNTLITQGGLVLKPGERIFLERYLDVAKKFMFDTYEISNTSEVKEAIKYNGDVKVEFFYENPLYLSNCSGYVTDPTPYNPFSPFRYDTNNCNTIIGNNTTATYAYYNANLTQLNGTNNTTILTNNLTNTVNKDISGTNTILKKKKSLLTETGRVEKGSNSNQVFKNSDKSFSILSFHTIEYKLLPTSQKVNTVDDIKIKHYCTNCGHKLKPTFKFCPACSTKV